MNNALNVHVYVTNKCNLNCKHCYSAFNIMQGDLISIIDICKAMERLNEKYDVSFDVEGGELFLRDDVSTMFEILKKNTLNRITITTNGTILPNISPIFLKELNEFRVSVEGHTQEIHSLLRNSSLSTIIKNCNSWIDEGIPIVIRMTLHKQNFKFLISAIEYFSSIGVKRFSFFEYQTVGKGKENGDKYVLSDDDVKWTIEELSNFFSKKKYIDYVKLSLPKCRDLLIEKLAFQNDSFLFFYEECRNTPSLTINYNGELGICPWKPQDTLISDFRTADFDENIERIILKQKKGHKCSHCTSNKLIFNSSD